MLRRTSLLFGEEIKLRWIFTNTDMGREALLKAREEVLHTQKGGSKILRFFLRKRRIDRLGIELHGPVTDQLHWTFPYVMKLGTALTVLPVAYHMMVTHKIRISYFFLVWPIKVLPEYKYDKVWEICSPYVVYATQLVWLFIWLDLSVYIRYPFYMSVVAPVYRALGLVKPAPKGAKTVEQLKQGLQHTKPLVFGVKTALSQKDPSVAARPLGKAAASAPSKVKAAPRQLTIEERAAQAVPKKKQRYDVVSPK